jgi:hypothetical protein
MYRWIAGLMVIVSLVTTGQDYLSALAKQGSYYFSESLLFSSFWWIFPPLLWLQFRQAGRLPAGASYTRLWWMIGPMTAHLLLYPTLVESLGQLTLGHGFRWTNTLTYGITQYGVVLLLGYSVPLLVIGLTWKTRNDHMPEAAADNPPLAPGIIDMPGPTGYQDSIMAKEGTRTIIVPVRDILLFTAASPYVKLHCAKRQFLVTETLRSLSSQLDPTRFCRIHKSTIVQLDAVAEMRSRLNGDYDLILSDGSITRLSRSFVQGFRKAVALDGRHMSADAR